MPRVFPTHALALPTFALALSIASSAAALDCDHRLVEVGDHAVQVRALCGEPASIAVRTESRTQLVEGRGRPGRIASAYTVTVDVEIWVYDFGPRRFMEELTFETGVLRSIRTLGYGTRAGRERRTAIDPPAARRERVALVGRRRGP